MTRSVSLGLTAFQLGESLRDGDVDVLRRRFGDRDGDFLRDDITDVCFEQNVVKKSLHTCIDRGYARVRCTYRHDKRR